MVYLPSKNCFREINVDGSTGKEVNGKPTANSRFKHAGMRSRGNSMCQLFSRSQAFPFFLVHCSAELLYSSLLSCQNKFGSPEIMKRLIELCHEVLRSFNTCTAILSTYHLRRHLGVPSKQGTTELVSQDLWPSSEMSSSIAFLASWSSTASSSTWQ